MSKSVTVVDYGIGNLYSVGRAFEKVGASVTVTDSPTLIRGAERLVLPGVGAFADGMEGLRQKRLVEPILAFHASQRPMLGICLGMQLLFEQSEEFGNHAGLGLIPGRIRAIPRRDGSGAAIRTPHIGWNALRLPDHRQSWAHSILGDCRPGDSVYFVHSFAAWPSNESHRLADSEYCGQRISAVVQVGSLAGCQFHPEKSGKTGLAIISAFLSLAQDR